MIIEPRRNHVSFILGKNLFIYGGINSHGSYLSNLIMLDLSYHYKFFIYYIIYDILDNGEWDECTALNSDNIGVAFHAGCLVIQSDKIENYKLFNFPEQKSNQVDLAHEGFYVFGGKNADDKVLNTLKIFKLGISFL